MEINDEMNPIILILFHFSLKNKRPIIDAIITILTLMTAKILLLLQVKTWYALMRK